MVDCYNFILDRAGEERENSILVRITADSIWRTSAERISSNRANPAAGKKKAIKEATCVRRKRNFTDDRSGRMHRNWKHTRKGAQFRRTCGSIPEPHVASFPGWQVAVCCQSMRFDVERFSCIQNPLNSESELACRARILRVESFQTSA